MLTQTYFKTVKKAIVFTTIIKVKFCFTLVVPNRRSVMGLFKFVELVTQTVIEFKTTAYADDH